jgi:hypothetical protein
MARLHLSALLVFGTVACGGAQPSTPPPAPSVERSASYANACRTASAAHEQAVKSLTYLPPKLKILGQQWIAEPAPEADGFIKEAELFAALREGTVKAVLIQARGGIGKTELSKTIFADACNTVPTFRVDLRETFLADDAAPSNRILLAMAAQLDYKSAEQQAQLADQLDRTRALLVLDSIEELPAVKRPVAIAALAELRQKYMKLQVVVMGRPAVLDARYGLQGLEGHLELPPLDCGRAKSMLLRPSEDTSEDLDAEKARVNAFVETWRLDRQSLIGMQCYLPYVATYRDVQVVQRLAKTFKPDEEMGGLRHNTSQVHEAILAERLLKELQHMGWTGEKALGLVDAMVATGGYVDGDWNLAFTIARCVASQPGEKPEVALQVCEKLFQSVVFEPLQANKPEWKFSHQAIADLFVARWLDAHIGKANSACDMVTQQADEFASKEVGGYLVGRPNGAKCLAQVTRNLCKAGGFNKGLVQQVQRGLPLGQARGEAVKAAKEWEAKNGKDACSLQILGVL